MTATANDGINPTQGGVTVRVTRSAVFALLACLMLFQSTVIASEPFWGYAYNANSDSVATPNVYHCVNVVSGADLGIDNMHRPSHLFYSEALGRVFILDAGNGRIISTNPDFTDLEVLDTFTSQNGYETLSYPGGLFVTDQGLIYIADTENERVVVVDPTQSPNIIRTIVHPNTETYDLTMPFRPTRVIVDRSGTVFVLSHGLFMGAVIFDRHGDFAGFWGANRVEATRDIITNMIWRRFMTPEQRAQVARHVPTEFTSFTLSNDGFIYTCTATTQFWLAHEATEQVKRLNLMGNNILTPRERGNNINTGNFGDIERQVFGEIRNFFVDIAVDHNGFFYLLCQGLGRVYWYNSTGDFVGAFGGTGDLNGTFRQVSALETVGYQIWVLDSNMGTISIFEKTAFGADVYEALHLYNDGLYIEAIQTWERVLRSSSNFLLGYVSLGHAYFQLGDYVSAMRYYRLSYSRNLYSDAFRDWRADFIRGNAGIVLVLIIVFGVGIKLGAWLWKRRKNGLEPKESHLIVQRLRYPFHAMGNITDSFSEIKIDQRASVFVAMGILLVFFIFSIVESLYMAFIFNTTIRADFNVLFTFVGTVVVFFLFAMCNWGVTTLFEGKGKFKHIVMVTGYALMPMLLVMVLNIFLSQVLTLEEGIFMSWFLYVSVVWSFIMLFKGQMEIHLYTGTKTFLSLLLTVVAMIAVVILAVLLFSLVFRIWQFVFTIYTEISLRYF